MSDFLYFQRQTTQMEVKYYNNIVDLPLNKFIDCLVDKNLYAIVISGEPDKEQLRQAWENILMEYNDAMGDGEDKMYWQMFKDVEVLRITMKEIDIDIQILSLQYDKKYADDLNNLLDSDFAFDTSDMEKYHNELKRCGNRSKGILIQYELKKGQFEEIKKKNEETNFKVSREYFQSILITLSDHAKYEITDKIPVFQFCERVKRFGQYIKSIESNGRRTHR
jgi:hypothetical protein